MNRQEDLTRVFDRTWKANHNDVAKRGREKEKKFMNKMFNTKDVYEKEVKVVTPAARAANLQKNIDGANNFYRQNKVNNIIGKWK